MTGIPTVNNNKHKIVMLYIDDVVLSGCETRASKTNE